MLSLQNKVINNAMRQLKKIEGFSNLYKDEETNIVLNLHSQDRERYRLSKQQAMNNLNCQYEIQNLKNELFEMKELLQKLITKV